MDQQFNTGNRRQLTAEDYAAMARATDDLLLMSSGIRRATTKALGDHYRSLAGLLIAKVKA